MNAAQIHLLFNHLPLVLLGVGFVVLLMGNRSMNLSYKKLGLGIFIAAALFTIPTQFSGEGAEHILQDMGLDVKSLVEKHETLGFFSAMLTYALGILSFISLMMIHNTHAFFTHLRKFILVLAAAGLLLMAITAHSGGEIRHTEIRLSSIL